MCIVFLYISWSFFLLRLFIAKFSDLRIYLLSIHNAAIFNSFNLFETCFRPLVFSVAFLFSKYFGGVLNNSDYSKEWKRRKMSHRNQKKKNSNIKWIYWELCWSTNLNALEEFVNEQFFLEWKEMRHSQILINFKTSVRWQCIAL